MKGLTLDVTWTGGEKLHVGLHRHEGDGGHQHDTGDRLRAARAKRCSGSYAEKALNQITVFVDKADSASLRHGCSADQTVTSATFDNSNSVAIL